MAEFTFTIPDQYVPDLIEAFGDKFNYPETIQDPNKIGPSGIPNPQSKSDFAKEKIKDFIKRTYIEYKSKLNAETAIQLGLDSAVADANNIT